MRELQQADRDRGLVQKKDDIITKFLFIRIGQPQYWLVYDHLVLHVERWLSMDVLGIRPLMKSLPCPKKNKHASLLVFGVQGRSCDIITILDRVVRNILEPCFMFGVTLW